MRFRRPALALLLLCLATAPAFAQRAKSLDAVPALLKSPEAKAVWAEQMDGRPAPDHLGTRELAGLDAGTLRRLLVPDVADDRIVLLGARRWAQHPGHVVALVCYRDDAPHNASAEPSCETGDTAQVIGVLRAGDAGDAQLVARLRLDEGIAWPLLSWGGEQPLRMEEAGASAIPERWERFDLAAYRLSSGAPALGLRGGWSEGYAGGGAFYSALYLFELRGDTLKQVFGAEMSMYRDIAGSWNDDGTREHDIEEWAGVLIVEPSAHHGYQDLRLRERGGRGGDLYRWSPAAHGYRRAD
ncbi:hypothetical protein [Luteimonas fraxinea]|uniref:hypothetical protein n=1 Tax=Luteimonas fraxinea TaxID=2901869 RepID=UPI001E5DA631|nr:hypothetical protein [Luteimonas fraxinea]MCD9126891.1 hypothetical protein [Luteimonas fraxinea]